MSTLAIDGGAPVRRDLLRGHRVSAGYEELRQMLEVFDNGKFCSVDPTAPKVPEFERAFADYVGVALRRRLQLLHDGAACPRSSPPESAPATR